MIPSEFTPEIVEPVATQEQLPRKRPSGFLVDSKKKHRVQLNSISVMVIPIDKQITELTRKQKLAKFTDAKIRRASLLTRPSDCRLCDKPIAPGEMYKDGGLRNRAHVSCVPEPQ